MIQHDHSEKVAGCFRCDLSSDELNSTIVFLTNLHKATEPGGKSREIALVEFGGGLLAEVDRLRAERYAALAKIQELQNDAARLEHTADAACSAREQMRDENAALDRKSTRLNSSHIEPSRMPSSA